MAYPRILTIQDISCVGQCSLTVALPIISACGVETCILPSAILSTHTAGFSGFTFHDLTDDMPAIRDHWEKENIKFDGIYTGYLGSTKQIDYVINIIKTLNKDGAKAIVDPAMADNGKLYPLFDQQYVEAMKGLCACADYVVPNITEACFLTGIEYKTEYDRSYIDEIIKKLLAIGSKNVVLTGVSYRQGKTGVVVFENGEYKVTVMSYKDTAHFLDDNYKAEFNSIKDDLSLIAYVLSPNEGGITTEKLSLTYLGLSSADECYVLKNLRDTLLDELKDSDRENLYYELELPLAKVLFDMEKTGFLADEEGLKRYSGELMQGINEYEQLIYGMVGHTFNINSPKQLGTVLFEELGLKSRKKTKTGYSTDAEVFALIVHSTQTLLVAVLGIYAWIMLQIRQYIKKRN